MKTFPKKEFFTHILVSKTREIALPKKGLIYCANVDCEKCAVQMIVPLKQGLKQDGGGADDKGSGGSDDSSTKTRIETDHT